MKRHYVRPLLLVERFELTQALSNCSLLIGHNDAGCVLADDDATDMMKSLALQQYFNGVSCLVPPVNMEMEDGICYNTSVNLAFSS